MIGEGKGILEDGGAGLGKVWEEEADEGGLRSAEAFHSLQSSGVLGPLFVVFAPMICWNCSRVISWGLMSAEQEAEEGGLGSGRSAEQEEDDGGLSSWSSQTGGVGVDPIL